MMFKPFKIQIARFVVNDEVCTIKREEFRRKLLNNGFNQVRRQLYGINKTSIHPTNIDRKEPDIPMLAWYEKDLSLLEAEKAAMHHAFPDFVLEKLDDGRLCWQGILTCLKVWTVNVIPDMDHWHRDKAALEESGTVRIYLIEPSIDKLVSRIGWQPYGLLTDMNNLFYICPIGQFSVSSAICSAIRWLSCFELVLTGELSPEDFDSACYNNFQH